MTRYALNLPVDLKQEAEQIAKRQGISLNQFIMWSVSEKVATIRNQQLDEDPKFPLIGYRRSVDGDATPVIRGTGIRVQTAAVAVNKLKTKPEEFARRYNVNISQVREALSYYESHKEQIEANIRYEDELEKQYKKERAKRNGKATLAPRR